MGIRNIIEGRPIVGIAIIVIALGLAGWMYSGSSSASAEGSRYYYDVQTGETVAFKAPDAMPPVTLPSGNEGVLVYMLSCGDCGSESFAGYLEKYTDAYIEAASVDPAMSNGPVPTPDYGHLVAAVPENGAAIQWFEMASVQGANLVRSVRQRCDGRPTTCIPQ